MRLALGASRGSLVRRLLTETTLLSCCPGSRGVGLVVWLLDLLVTADLPRPTPVTLDLCLDGYLLAFTFSVSVVAGTLLGLAPGAAKHPAGRRRRPQERKRRRRPARSAPVAQHARRHATHELAGAAGRRRAAPPQLSAGPVGRTGLLLRADRPHDPPDAGDLAAMAYVLHPRAGLQPAGHAPAQPLRNTRSCRHTSLVTMGSAGETRS